MKHIGRAGARCGVIVAFLVAGASFAKSSYQKPQKSIADVLHAPSPPTPAVSPSGHSIILMQPVRHPPISFLAQPFLRLAGSRVVPKNNSIHGASYWSAYAILNVRTGDQAKIASPRGAKLGMPKWTADSKRFAFSNVTPRAVELWVGEVATGKARRVANILLNPALEDEFQWMPDQKSLLVKAVPKNRGVPPNDVVPQGPSIQETLGAHGPSSTYELRDVLKSPLDEDLFDFYGSSQLAIVDTTSGKVTSIGPPALYAGVSPSPDGKYLLVESIHRPYSHIVGHSRFPREFDVWDGSGKVVHRIATRPLAESVPIWGVATGPREFDWRPTEPATLTWAEALDKGDWRVKVPHRDRVMMVKAPFKDEPTEITRTEQRFSGFWWGEKKDLALLTDRDRIKHWLRVYSVNLDEPKPQLRLIWDRSSDDHYQNPGAPVFRYLPNGFRVLDQDQGRIYLSGLGATPDGERPFLDRLDLASLSTERIFRSDKNWYESFIAWSDFARKEFITRRESPTEPPNIFVRTLDERIAQVDPGEAAWTSKTRALTHFADPAPAVRGITKRLVKYKRADGMDLSFTLYLPPGYKQGTRLPAVLWAYPLDYADAQMAGQVTGSPQRFTVFDWPLQLFYLLDGYAVIDNPSLPVVGDTFKIYDTYMEQLVAGAKAAVDKATELGVIDPERIGITGHSHGALMTANLLIHSNLFRAGVARSGAYNRSLTSFGFQSERRTLWEATDVYVKVSPFFHADKLKSPILLIHGEADINPGTVPLQSEKFYQAIHGLGGTAKLVMLPSESHGYRAMESIEHVLYESLAWFDRYVKKASPRSPATTSIGSPAAQPVKSTVAAQRPGDGT